MGAQPQPFYICILELTAWTNKDYALEGELSEEEGWTVPFNGAEAILFSSWIDDDGDGMPDVLDWTGSLSFTVEITRSPHVA